MSTPFDGSRQALYALPVQPVVFVDGASSGNPGRAAAAWVVDGETPRGVVLGDALTNNEAEYWALIFALTDLLERGLRGAEIRMDSRLVVEQLRGTWKVKEPRLQVLHRYARTLLEKTGARVVWIPREENRANALAQKLARRGDSS